MSSKVHLPINGVDISIIRTVLRHSGFRYEEPMCELDRGAVRLTLRLYQNGMQKAGHLMSAIETWADEAALARVSPCSGRVKS